MERYFKFSELSKLEQQMYYNYIYLFLMEANMQYPAFSVWYGNLFTDDLKLKPEREIIVCEKEYEIAGVTILKSTKEEAKICTMYVAVQEVLDKGNEFLDKIHRSNDAIPGEEISAKISRMELIVEKIFERAQKHPEIIPDLKKLMNYYLPMTVKLLDAYEEMDQQPVQGENIQASKKEIEDTLDTLNQAFEKLLDSVFQDTAWDVSSDISVLHTLLAQEGLTDDDFAKMKKN